MATSCLGLPHCRPPAKGVTLLTLHTYVTQARERDVCEHRASATLRKQTEQPLASANTRIGKLVTRSHSTGVLHTQRSRRHSVTAKEKPTRTVSCIVYDSFESRMTDRVPSGAIAPNPRQNLAAQIEQADLIFILHVQWLVCSGRMGIASTNTISTIVSMRYDIASPTSRLPPDRTSVNAFLAYDAMASKNAAGASGGFGSGSSAVQKSCSSLLM
jgi:hypothetical protein